MARLVVAGPAKFDVGEILTKLSQGAGYPVSRRAPARHVLHWDRTSEFVSCNPSSLSTTTNGDEAMILRVVDGRRQITPELLGRR